MGAEDGCYAMRNATAALHIVLVSLGVDEGRSKGIPSYDAGIGKAGVIAVFEGKVGDTGCDVVDGCCVTAADEP